MTFLTFRRLRHERPFSQPAPVRISELTRTPARQLTLVRRRTQPSAVYIARLSATATIAYLIALLVPSGTSRPVLAPLTALLVLQASLFQTIRSAFRKVISVTAGVVTAVIVSAFVGFSWWLLALVIAGALILGTLLRLGDDLLEVPISAMLIFSSVGANTAATGRITDTLVGSAAGLLGGVLFAPLRVQPAREAVGELSGRLAGVQDRIAYELTTEEPHPDRVDIWLQEANALRGEIGRVDERLRQAEESARLNPRSLRVPEVLPESEIALRRGLETLEHSALTLRALARAMIDSSRIESEASPVRDSETRAWLGTVLGQLAEAVRTYGRLLQTPPVTGLAASSADSEELEAELAWQLAEAHHQQDRLADLLRPSVDNSEWPLRGEILAQVDRLRTGLQADTVPRPVPGRPRLLRRQRQRPPRHQDLVKRPRDISRTR
jgi:fusaric acid resistance family protein